MPEIPHTMWAWQKHRGQTQTVKCEIPVPSAPADGYLIKIHASGVCHSDYTLMTSTQSPPNFKAQYTLGHEGCGEIVQIGENVRSGLDIGEMIVILSIPGCGASSCPDCSRGLPQLCHLCDNYGIGSSGSHTSYVAIKAHAAIPLPKGVSAAVGAVATDAIMTAHHAVTVTAKVQKSQNIVVFGLGGLGLNALQIVLSIGSTVYVVENRQEVIDEAIKLGVPADNAFLSADKLTQHVMTNGIVIDSALDFVGLQETFAAAEVVVRSAGKIVLVGMLTRELNIRSGLCMPKQLSILYNFGGGREDIEKGLEMVAKGTLKPLVETGPLSEFPRFLDELHHGKIKGRIALVPDW